MGERSRARPPPIERRALLVTRTTTQLLASLRDPANAGPWQDFDARYRPILIGFARRQGLCEEEAGEVAQETLAQFASAYVAGKYDRERGRLSSWIIGIACHRIADVGRERRRHAGERGESVLVDLPNAQRAEKDWEEETQRVVMERALEELRSQTRLDERTIRAFELSALRSMPAEAVAAECQMSVPEVYVAKNRAIKKLREIVARLSEEFTEPEEGPDGMNGWKTGPRP